MSSPQPSLSWPTSPTPLRIAELRSVVDRLTALAHAHERELAVIPGLATTDEEVAADPPPALEQVTDELGGLSVRGRRELDLLVEERDRKSTRLNSSHVAISYAVFCLKKKRKTNVITEA